MTAGGKPTRWLLLCGVIGPPAVAAVFLAAAARHPGYDHVSDTISKLSAQGVGGGWLWTAGLVLFGWLMVGFGGGLQRSLGGDRPSAVAGWSLRVHGGLLAVIALVRDDVRPGGFFTVEGAVHDVISGVAFTALLVAMAAVAVRALQVPSWRWLGRLTIGVGFVVATVAIAFVFTPPRVQGIPQRIFTGAGVLWIEMMAVWSMVRLDERSV